MATQKFSGRQLAKTAFLPILGLCAIWYSAEPTALAQGQQKGFIAAQVLSASNVPYPLNTTAEGFVVLNVSLDAEGQPGKITVLSGVSPLTEAAETSLHSWTFIPAVRNGAGQASQMLVAFVFRHGVQMSSGPPVFAPISAAQQPAGYSSPAIRSATYAEYPTSTVAAGAVVLQASIQPDGSAGGVDVLRGMDGGFTPLAVGAALRWAFQPATLEGVPVRSAVAIAFIFSSRAMNPF